MWASSTIPVRVAVQFRIPLIIWGENSQNEYGGPDDASAAPTLTRALARGVRRTTGPPGFRPLRDLRHRAASACALPVSVGGRTGKCRRSGLFLGHYLPVDGLANVLLAQAYGFSSFEGPVEGSMVSYENLDNHQHGIHDYFKLSEVRVRTSD